MAVFEAQEIISIGCDGKEIEGRAAQLGWGHVTQDLECQGEESMVKWEGNWEPGDSCKQDQSSLAAVWAGARGRMVLIKV